MKKVRGKALALVLSLALVVSSFSTVLASAASRHTVNGTVSDTDNDEIYLVNGGADDEHLSVKDLQKWIFDGGDATLETKEHKVVDAKISAISHASGDRVVKWYDANEKKSISDDTENVVLQLRSPSSEGHEVLNIQYSGSYSDDDDKEYTVKGSKEFDVYALANNQAVVGLAGGVTAGEKAELDDDFAQKTIEHEIKKEADKEDDISDNDSKDLTVYLAQNTGSDAKAVWKAVPTKVGDTFTDDDQEDNTSVYYTLDVNSDGIKLTEKGDFPATLSDTPATATKPGLRLNDDGDIEIVAPTAAYTYKYVFADEAKTEEADFASADTVTGAIDLPAEPTDDQKVLSVAAYKDGAFVGVSSSEYTEGTDQAAGEGGYPDAAATGTAPKIEVAADGESAAISAPTYSYVSSEDGTAPSEAVSDNKITAPTTQKTIKVAIAGDVDDTTVTATYTPAKRGSDAAAEGVVTATVADDASTGSVTFTATPTDWAKEKEVDGEGIIADDKDVKTKVKIAKQILVGDSGFKNIGKYSGTTYIYTGTLTSDSDEADDTHTASAVKVNGYDVNFDTSDAVTVDEKAAVTKISGTVGSLTVSSGNVSEIDLDGGNVTVDDAKTGNIHTEGGSSVEVTAKASTGDITAEDGEAKITVNSGKTGALDAETVEVYADEDDFTTTTGDIKAKSLTVDSKDSKVTTGTIAAKDSESEFTVSGSNVDIKDFDFDYRNTDLKFDDFQGKINAPKNADAEGATLALTNSDDRVEVVGDADIDNVTIEDEAIATYDGGLNVTSLDGSGTLQIAAGKLYIDGDASGVILKLTDATLTKGQTVFTALADTVDEDDLDTFGFTLTKSAGSTTDTFKIADLQFAGVAINKTSASIANGYSETFTASAYPAGTTLPANYGVTWSLDDANDSIFALTINDNGTATVKVIGYDDKFPVENKATLKAELVDENGDIDDEYAPAEVALTALKVPATNFKSDTTGYLNLKVGQTYQFKITSTDGTAPTFGVAGNGATVQYAGATGNDYFYKVTGAKEGSYGVYVNGGGDEHRAAILVIKGVNVTTDTTAVTKAPGQTYQFKITAPSQPNFVAVGLKSVLASKSGNNYFYKVTASNVKGGHGIYVNGVRVAIFTVA